MQRPMPKRRGMICLRAASGGVRVWSVQNQYVSEVLPRGSAANLVQSPSTDADANNGSAAGTFGRPDRVSARTMPSSPARFRSNAGVFNVRVHLRTEKENAASRRKGCGQATPLCTRGAENIPQVL